MVSMGRFIIRLACNIVQDKLDSQEIFFDTLNDV